MKRLLLTAYGLCTDEIKEAFYKLLPENFSDFRVVIVTTSQPKLKEKHPQMISVKCTFHEMGFESVDFIDIEFEDSNKLQNYDIIFLNGGYPFYLMHHLKKTGTNFKEHCSIYPDFAEKILEFESKYNCEVTRLNNNQAILVLGDKLEYIEMGILT